MENLTDEQIVFTDQMRRAIFNALTAQDILGKKGWTPDAIGRVAKLVREQISQLPIPTSKITVEMLPAGVDRDRITASIGGPEDRMLPFMAFMRKIHAY